MVTAIVNDPGIKPGQVLDWTNCRTFTAFKGAGVITRGDLLVPDTGTAPDGVKLSPASRNIGPFYVAMETVASAATQISVAQGGVIALTADGTIEVHKMVQTATGTAGQVIVFAATNIATTLTDTGIEAAVLDSEYMVGECLGFADNYDTNGATAPVDGDLVAVRMRV
jgi:hypothetical protein